MKENDVTLAKHFLKSALLIMEKEKQKSPGVDRLKAEIHCLLAFIARESSENVGRRQVQLLLSESLPKY